MAGKLYQVTDYKGEVQSRRFHKESDALEWKLGIIRDRERVRAKLPPLSESEPPLPVEQTSFVDDVAEYLRKEERSPSLVQASFNPMSARLRFLAEELGFDERGRMRPTSSVTANLIEDALDELQRKRTLSNATRNHYRYCLFKFYEWARRRRVCVLINPVVDVPRAKALKVRPSGCWDEPQYAQRYLTTAKEDGIMWEAISKIRVYQGLRGSEVVGLKRQDVDLKNNCLHVRRIFDKTTRRIVGRTKSYRDGEGYRAPLFPETAAALRAWMKEMTRKCPDDFLFYQIKKGNQGRKPFLSTEFLRRKHYEFCRRAKVPFVRPHGMRHFCITQGQKEGMSLKDMQAVVGHKSDLVTSGYTHLEDTRYLTEKAARCGFAQIRRIPDNVVELRREA